MVKMLVSDSRQYFDFLDVREGGAVIGKHRVDKRDAGAALHQCMREVGPDEAESTGHEDGFSRVEVTHF